MTEKGRDIGHTALLLMAGAAVGSLIFGIWGYLQTPSADIVATVRYASLTWPPGSSGNQRLSGTWTLQVTNKGDLAASSLSLMLPYAVLFSARKEGGETEIIETEEVIDLGDLLPLESISVTAWTTIEPSTSIADRIRLSHESGIGTVRLYAELSPIWVWLNRGWWYPVLFVFMIFGMIANSLIDHFRKGTSEERNLSG